MGLGNTLVLLNAWRRRNLLPGPISYGALQRFVANSPVLKIDKRELRKAGTDDEESGWALARHAFAQQLFRQFRKGKRIAAGGPAYVEAEDGLKAQADLEANRLRTPGARMLLASRTSRPRWPSTTHLPASTRTATSDGSSARGRPRRCGTS